jgi:hypothetical protein
MNADKFESKLAATYQSIKDTLVAWDEVKAGSFSVDDDPSTAEDVAHLMLIFQDLSDHCLVDETGDIRDGGTPIQLLDAVIDV